MLRPSEHRKAEVMAGAWGRGVRLKETGQRDGMRNGPGQEVTSLECADGKETTQRSRRERKVREWKAVEQMQRGEAMGHVSGNNLTVRARI